MPEAVGGGKRSARLERRSWIMALAIFTGVVLISGSAPYFLSSSVTRGSFTNTKSQKSLEKQLLAQTHVNGSWEDELRQSLGLQKCPKPQAK
jgi:hypothetical protein